jgi:hypothetical protein
MSIQPALSGEQIRKCITNILDRCADFESMNRFPGEGGERRFRMWLATDLITEILGWPGPMVVQGERFDLLLQDHQSAPTITFETKTPYHQPSATEREDFVGRLPAFPTLRFGVLTSGDSWEIYRIEHSLGTASVHLVSAFDLATATDEEIESALEPLVYVGLDGSSTDIRFRIAKGEPFIATALLRLTAHLEAGIADLQRNFMRLFHGIRSGEAGPEARSVLEAIYERWSGESLKVSPSTLAHALSETIVEEGRSALALTKCLNSLGFAEIGIQEVVDTLLALSYGERPNEEQIVPLLWPVFEPWIGQLCAQTAHVQLARVLLYRVGEDETIFDRRISGEPLRAIREKRRTGVTGREYPALEAVENVRESMESLLPSIFKLSEFDWWMVRPDYRSNLKATQKIWLQVEDEKYNVAMLSLLTRLNGYDFTGVDIDVWRNLYENYLPKDERQRLGGFYTPEALVDLTLDLAGFTSDADGLCKLSFIDPSCGSGAFVTTALGRLLNHLATPMACHADLHSRSKSSLQRAESLLRLISRNVNAIDVHPFASFLTTLNVLFAVLPRYVQVREHDPDFVMEFNIFAWDTLDPPTEQPTQTSLFARMNARHQRGEHDYERYRQVMQNQFDRILGNPPWGGVLNGPLAPVYDVKRKKAFKQLYPSAAQGKYDVYGLFLQRAIQLLRPNGKLALITQATYIEKEWAGGLRALLASHTSIEWIVDLNPFGQLFFRAMNAPCITVATLGTPDHGHKVNAILSSKPGSYNDANRERRQLWVADTIREASQTMEHSARPVVIAFASCVSVPQSTLLADAASRWNLAQNPDRSAPARKWHAAAGLLEVRQGVTPGNALEVFLMDWTAAQHLKLESTLLHKAIKSRDITRWSLNWNGLGILYPYVVVGKKAQPAFRIQTDKVEDPVLRKRITQLGLRDALNFDIQLDDWERQLVRQKGITKETVAKLLTHRIANGLVQYPMTARYLCSHYDRLEKRIFKHKNIRDFNREWYEMIWPRDPKLMLAKQRILSPRLVRTARFVLDVEGSLSDDACLFLQPTKKTDRGWKALSSQMETCLGRKAKPKELLVYCLAFLNSSRGSAALLEGRRPTPKGSYQISEQSLREIFIAPPEKAQRAKVLSLIESVEKLVAASGTFHASDRERLEPKINTLVEALLESTRD